MSIQANTVFAQQYAENVLFLSQQKGSKLGEAVTVHNDVRGEYAFFDQVGPTGYGVIMNRNGDSPLINTPFARRRVQMGGYEFGDLIDKTDEVQMLIDPTSATARNAAFSMGRAKDDVIYQSFFNTAYTNSGLDGVTPTSVTFPAANVIAVNDRTFQEEGNATNGNSSLTVSKLIYAKDLFGTYNVDLEGDEVYCATAQQGIAALLTATPVTSIWYNSVKPLVSGDVDQFMGINIIHTELTLANGNGVSQKDGSGYMNAPVWCKSGVALGIGEDIMSMIQPRPDKRFSTYVYFQMLLGATRLEENKVVQLKCDLTKTN